MRRERELEKEDKGKGNSVGLEAAILNLVGVGVQHTS